MTKRHKKDTSTFAELDFAGQSRSITATINQVFRALRAHERKAKKEGRPAEEIMKKRIAQIRKMLARLEGAHALSI